VLLGVVGIALLALAGLGLRRLADGSQDPPSSAQVPMP
jgi:hypothetical protein